MPKYAKVIHHLPFLWSLISPNLAPKTYVAATKPWDAGMGRLQDSEGILLETYTRASSTVTSHTPQDGTGAVTAPETA